MWGMMMMILFSAHYTENIFWRTFKNRKTKQKQVTCQAQSQLAVRYSARKLNELGAIQIIRDTLGGRGGSVT